MWSSSGRGGSTCSSPCPSLYLSVFVLSAALLCSMADGKTFRVNENSPEGTLIADLIKEFNIELAEHRASELAFLISDQPISNHLAISDGQLKCNDLPLDREELCPGSGTCKKSLTITLVSPRQYFRKLDLEVEIVDENDNPPVFSSPSFQLNVPESVTVGGLFNLPLATDRDVGQNDVRFYRINQADDTADLPFELQTKSTNGRMRKQISLRVKSDLDREEIPSYRFRVEAVDGGLPEPKTGTLEVLVKVTDVNDNGPIFERALYRVEVDENFPVGEVIVTVKASDADEGPNGEITYELVPGQWHEEQTFSLDEVTGELRLISPFDHSKSAEYSVEIMATDSGPEAFSNVTRVEIIVKDINDNPPRLVLNPLNEGRAEIYENVEPGSFVLHLLAIDEDSGDNGRVNCSISDAFPEENAFALEQIGGNEFRLVTTSNIDREAIQSYRLTLLCHDFGAPQLTSTFEVSIMVIDEDDNPPFFEKSLYAVELEENNRPGQFLLQVNAADLDSGIEAPMKFHLCRESAEDGTGAFVSVDETTGRISALQSFDHETRNEYQFCVTVSNKCKDCSRSPTTSSATATTTILLKVLDRNDNAPEFMRKMYRFEIPENSPFSTEVGTLRAVDADSGAFNEFFFLLVDGSSSSSSSSSPSSSSSFLPFQVDRKSGKIITTASLDREIVSSYNFSAKAVDANDSSLSSSVLVEVKIFDLNDNAPSFLGDCQNSKVDLGLVEEEVVEVCKFVASDPDEGDNGLVTYSLVRDFPHKIFNISSRDGTLNLLTFGLIDSHKDLFINSTAVVNVTVLAKDNGSPQLSTVLRTTAEINLLPAFSMEALREKRDGFFAGRPLRIVALCACVLVVLGAIIVMIVFIIRRKRKATRHPHYDVQRKQAKIVPRDFDAGDADETDNLKSSNDNNSNNNKAIVVCLPNQKFYEEERGQPLKYDFSDVPNPSQIKKKGKPTNDNNQYFSLTKKRKGSITDKHQDKRDATYKPSADPPKKQPVFFAPQISSDESMMVAGGTGSERNLHSPAFNQGPKVSADAAIWNGSPPDQKCHKFGEPNSSRLSTSPTATENYPYSQMSTFSKNNASVETDKKADSKNIYY